MTLRDIAYGRSTVLATVLVFSVSLGAWLVQPTCEPRGRVVVTDTETTILDVVEFLYGTAKLCPRSQPTLDAVAATLIGNPSIQLVEVQSHTSDANLDLSQERAEVVVAYLVAAGVAPERLHAEGYSNSQPIDRAVPWKNERISFLILQRSAE